MVLHAPNITQHRYDRDPHRRMPAPFRDVSPHERRLVKENLMLAAVFVAVVIVTVFDPRKKRK
jgi:hypothetical protein